MPLDPTQLAATTSAIATVIFSKALEKGGEHLGDAVYQKFGNLIGSIREKFQQTGAIATLQEAEVDPTVKNINQFAQELTELMTEDEAFATSVESLLTSFCEDVEIKKIIAEKQIDEIKQPLSVAHLITDKEIAPPTIEKQSLKVEDALKD